MQPLSRGFAALPQWMIELDEEQTLAESRILALNHAAQTWLQAYDEVSDDSILVSNHSAVRLQLPSTVEINHLVHFQQVCENRLEFSGGWLWDRKLIIRGRHSDHVRELHGRKQHLVVERGVSLRTREQGRKSLG